MKLKYVASLSALLLQMSTAMAAEASLAAYQVPKAVQSLLIDIELRADDGYVVAGERGHILVSKNGADWQQSVVPTQAMLNSVYFPTGNKGFAVGHDATILSTQDKGLTWQLQQAKPELDKPLFDVYFRNENEGIAVGAYGLFFRTTDGGQQWTQEYHLELASPDDQTLLAELKDTDPDAYQIEMNSVLPHFNRVYADGNILFMVGEAGFVAKSLDFGVTWQRLPEFYNGSLFGITRTAGTSLIAVGLRGHVFRSNDHGATWQQIELPVQITLNSVISDPKGPVYLVGNAGTLLVSHDDGLSFHSLAAGDNKALMDAVVVPTGLVVAGETGVRQITTGQK
jgi:photosystem II stability/assembly factor-like uncharacterized protein